MAELNMEMVGSENGLKWELIATEHIKPRNHYSFSLPKIYGDTIEDGSNVFATKIVFSGKIFYPRITSGYGFLMARATAVQYLHGSGSTAYPVNIKICKLPMSGYPKPGGVPYIIEPKAFYSFAGTGFGTAFTETVSGEKNLGLGNIFIEEQDTVMQDGTDIVMEVYVLKIK